MHACMHAGMEQLKWGGATASGAHGRISTAAGSGLPSHAHRHAMPHATHLLILAYSIHERSPRTGASR